MKRLLLGAAGVIVHQQGGGNKVWHWLSAFERCSFLDNPEKDAVMPPTNVGGQARD